MKFIENEDGYLLLTHDDSNPNPNPNPNPDEPDWWKIFWDQNDWPTWKIVTIVLIVLSPLVLKILYTGLTGPRRPKGVAPY